MQACPFRIGSFSSGKKDMVFFSNLSYGMQEYGAASLEYSVKIDQLRPEDTNAVWEDINYDVTGFEIKFSRHVTKYLIQYYLSTGIFVIVSWVRYKNKIFAPYNIYIYIYIYI